LLLKPPNFSTAKPPRPSKARSSNSRSSTSKSRATGTVQSRKVSEVADSGSNKEMPHVLREANSPSNGVNVVIPSHDLNVIFSLANNRTNVNLFY
jgi:hypothetical protein